MALSMKTAVLLVQLIPSGCKLFKLSRFRVPQQNQSVQLRRLSKMNDLDKPEPYGDGAGHGDGYGSGNGSGDGYGDGYGDGDGSGRG
jgi:hypothetical protein